MLSFVLKRQADQNPEGGEQLQGVDADAQAMQACEAATRGRAARELGIPGPVDGRHEKLPCDDKADCDRDHDQSRKNARA